MAAASPAHAAATLQLLPCDATGVPQSAAPTSPAASLLRDALNILDNGSGGTPLLFAAQRGLHAVVAALAGGGADVLCCCFRPSCNGALHVAALLGSVETCRVLVSGFGHLPWWRWGGA